VRDGVKENEWTQSFWTVRNGRKRIEAETRRQDYVFRNEMK